MRQYQCGSFYRVDPSTLSNKTYSSWLDQVEIWFSTVERDVMARGNLCQREGSDPQASPLYQRLLHERYALVEIF